MFVLCGKERALVIDCGTGVGDFKSVIEKITSLPYDVVMTHVHPDHIGGRGQFSEIMVSYLDSQYIKGVNYPIRKAFILSNRLMGNNFKGLNVKPVKMSPRFSL